MEMPLENGGEPGFVLVQGDLLLELLMKGCRREEGQDFSEDDFEKSAVETEGAGFVGGVFVDEQINQRLQSLSFPVGDLLLRRHLGIEDGSAFQ